MAFERDTAAEDTLRLALADRASRYVPFATVIPVDNRGRIGLIANAFDTLEFPEASIYHMRPSIGQNIRQSIVSRVCNRINSSFGPSVRVLKQGVKTAPYLNKRETFIDKSWQGK